MAQTTLEEARRILAERQQSLAEVLPELPPAPESLEDTGLRETFMVELVLKLLFLRGHLTGREICEQVGLPYPGVIEHVLRVLKDESYAAVRRGESVYEPDWEFYATEKGGNYARDVIPRNGYAGPAPVTLREYNRVAGAQLPEWQRLNRAHMRGAFRDLVVSDDMLMKLGPAFNSGKSMFLYGAAGNGKTMMSEKMMESLRGAILIPHAIEAGGHVVQLFDPTHHEVMHTNDGANLMTLDRRWMVIRRPFIIVGGELVMHDLEMAWDRLNNHYIAPLQLKANAGVFMIDDFGRQRMPARDLLNRWIVPLEKCYDFHLLSGGVQMQVPFNVLIIFSTNLQPKDLVEEAFLRRIRYKIEVGDPSEEQFREIFINYCKSAKLPYRPDMLDYLIERHYHQTGRRFRATHPRDIISQLIDIARFNELKIELNESLLDAAVSTYFVELG